MRAKRIQPYLTMAAVPLLLCWSAISTPSQTEVGQIAGVVFDPSRREVPDVGVVALELETKTTRTAKSSSGGKYVIPDLKAGSYMLTATVQGFETFTQRVSVATGSKVRVDIHLNLARAKP